MNTVTGSYLQVDSLSSLVEQERNLRMHSVKIAQLPQQNLNESRSSESLFSPSRVKRKAILLKSQSVVVENETRIIELEETVKRLTA